LLRVNEDRAQGRDRSFQLRISVIGGVGTSSVAIIRKRWPSFATAYCWREIAETGASLVLNYRTGVPTLDEPAAFPIGTAIRYPSGAT
jgi:hypothetical protein